MPELPTDAAASATQSPEQTGSVAASATQAPEQTGSVDASATQSPEQTGSVAASATQSPEQTGSVDASATQSPEQTGSVDATETVPVDIAIPTKQDEEQNVSEQTRPADGELSPEPVIATEPQTGPADGGLSPEPVTATEPQTGPADGGMSPEPVTAAEPQTGLADDGLSSESDSPMPDEDRCSGDSYQRCASEASSFVGDSDNTDDFGAQTRTATSEVDHSDSSEDDPDLFRYVPAKAPDSISARVLKRKRLH